jgi:DNA polymerase elongation subunit (family B)
MRGWIIDVYPDYRLNKMVVWLKKEDRRVVKLTDSFTPAFYATAKGDGFDGLMQNLAFSPSICRASYESAQRFIDGNIPQRLLKIEVPRYSHLSKLAESINKEGGFSRYHLYNVDINLALRYIFSKGISPMLLLSVQHSSAGLNYKLLERPDELCYQPPELRAAEIVISVNRQGRVAKMSDPLESIALISEDERFVFNGDERKILVELAAAVKKLDPDLVYVRKNDSEGLPHLYHRSEVCGLADGLQLGREHDVQLRKREGKSYFTYGRIVYKPPSYSLKGRLFIDRGSFLYRESGVFGLIDLARFSGVPMQSLSRMSPGNAITTMQLRYAYENKILIPWKRQNPEYFKTAWKLLQSDRGGYIFDPKVGVFDNVAELDFASMYPNIMVKFNISPETVLCSCCNDSDRRVPVLDYHICEKRIGLVPEVLEPVIERRFAFKRLKKTSKGETARQYGEMQAILKWLLITSFGYQGYRNARFGRIESHESICAYGRELLLRAKELSEYFGFEVLHGLVDSLWIKREASVSELEELCELISAEIEIDINLEGRYKWIVFLPNKLTHVGALNRYYGLFEDGSIKVRGVEIRMRNTPIFIKDYQKAVLDVLSKAENVEELHAQLGRVFDVMRRFVSDIREFRVNSDSLVFKVSVTRHLAEYRVNNFPHAALKQLRDEGIEVVPGQSVRYIVSDQKSKRYSDKVTLAEVFSEGNNYDVDFYVTQLLKATESLLIPFGYTVDRLRDVLRGHEQTSLQGFSDVSVI